MNSFDFYTPTKIYFGKDRHKNAGEIIASYGFHKILLHYGGGTIKKTGVYDAVTASLRANGIEFVELGGVEPNPKLSLVRKAVELCRAEKVEMILAVGGGSVIDSAKSTAVATPSSYDPWSFSTKEVIAKTALPVGVILTLSAAGSEMSSSCVITNEEEKLKRGYGSEYNRPLFAIMNPELTFTVSKYQTASGVVDILMHTLERYFQPSDSSELTDSLAEALLRSVIGAGKIAIQNPCDYEARATLMWAGSLSHNDLTGAGKTPGLQVHQLEHEVSGMFDEVAHGAGLSVLFPAWAEYVYRNHVMKFCRFAVNVWGCTMDFSNPEQTARAGIEQCREYFGNVLQMPLTLKELDVPEESFLEMAEKCTSHGKKVIPGIQPLGTNDILEIFKLAR